jgi:hypothetical protein
LTKSNYSSISYDLFSLSKNRSLLKPMYDMQQRQQALPFYLQFLLFYSFLLLHLSNIFLRIIGFPVSSEQLIS